jgi:hypothetical protein
MPLGKNVKYRVTTKGGKKIRLAFVNGKVVEAKNLKSGAVHTPAEFAADKRRQSTRGKSGMKSSKKMTVAGGSRRRLPTKRKR